MKYPLVQIPSFANKSFFDFSKEEAREYFQWYLHVRNERQSILKLQINLIFNSWQANYSRESLEVLYEWVSKMVAYREMTKEEKNAVQYQISETPLYNDIIPIPDKTFTVETVSICFDIGIYFGEALIFNNSNVKWLQKLSSKNYIDYAQPLIGKNESKVPINPRRIAESIAQRILDGDAQITYAMLFDKWVDKFKQ